MVGEEQGKDLPSQLVERLEAFGEAARVRLLGLGQRLEPFGGLGEALLARLAREARIHLRVLVSLAFDGGLQVVLGGAELHTGDGVANLSQQVEMAEGMAGL